MWKKTENCKCTHFLVKNIFQTNRRSEVKTHLVYIQFLDTNISQTNGRSEVKTHFVDYSTTKLNKTNTSYILNFYLGKVLTDSVQHKNVFIFQV